MKKLKHYFYRMGSQGWRVAVFTMTVMVGLFPVAHGLIAPRDVIKDSAGVVKLFCGALDWMFWSLIVFSVVMALVAGYIYAASSGDPEKVSKATKTFTYVVIAIVVALIAKGLPILVGGLLGVTSDLNACSGVGSPPAGSPVYICNPSNSCYKSFPDCQGDPKCPGGAGCYSPYPKQDKCP